MKDGKDGFSGDWAKYMGMGFNMFAGVAIFGAIGYFVDRHWGTSPIGLIGGTVLGMVVGFYTVLKELSQTDKTLWKDLKGTRNEDGKSDDDRK